MTETLKPGTRCEYRERIIPMERCYNAAVRLVTVVSVPPLYEERLGIANVERRAVPMCAACAEYHERNK